MNIDSPGTTGAHIADRTVIHAKGGFREHVFYDHLVQNRGRVDWDSVVARLAGVSDATIDALAMTWPATLEPHRSKFVEFLKCRRAHSCEIAANVAMLVGGE